MSRYPARRNNSDAIVTLRVNYEQQNLSVSDTEDDEAMLFVVSSIINALDGERVIEYCSCQFKTHAVSFEIRLSPGLVPFKLQSYDTTGDQ